MKFAKDYDFEYAGNAEEMQRADREQNKELYEALENHDIIFLEKQDAEQQENIPVEYAHKRNFSNLRIEFNEIETEDLDKGFVLKGDTEKEKDLMLNLQPTAALWCLCFSEINLLASLRFIGIIFIAFRTCFERFYFPTSLKKLNPHIKNIKMKITRINTTKKVNKNHFLRQLSDFSVSLFCTELKYSPRK